MLGNTISGSTTISSVIEWYVNPTINVSHAPANVSQGIGSANKIEYDRLIFTTDKNNYVIGNIRGEISSEDNNPMFDFPLDKFDITGENDSIIFSETVLSVQAINQAKS